MMFSSRSTIIDLGAVLWLWANQVELIRPDWFQDGVINTV
jgi:hypothetical protein